MKTELILVIGLAISIIALGFLLMTIAFKIFGQTPPDPALEELMQLNNRTMTLQKDIAELKHIQLNCIDILTEVREITPDTLWIPENDTTAWRQPDGAYSGIMVP